MAEAIGTAVVRIVPDTTQFNNALTTLGYKATTAIGAGTSAMGAFQAAAIKTQASLLVAGNRATNLGKSLTGFTVAGAGFLYFGAKAATSFDTEMRKLGAISEANAEQFKQLEAGALKFGRAGVFTASEVASGMTELARAGFNTSQILAATRGVLSLAAVEEMALSDAAEITAITLASFRMSAAEANRVTDALTQTANATTTSVSELAYAMKYVAPVAAASKVSFEETAAALGLLAQGGFKGTMGGTALRGVIASLEAPTKKGAAVIERLGITTKDSAGKLLPLNEIIAQFEKSTLSTADAITLMGKRAGPGFLNLVNFGSKALVDLTQKNREAGKEFVYLSEYLKFTRKQQEELTAAFRFSYPEVAKYGFNIDETTTIMAQLIKRGASAGDAMNVLGSVLRATKNDAILPLIGATRNLQGQLVDSSGEVLSLQDVLARLQSGGLTTADSLSVLGEDAAGLATAAGLSSDEMGKLLGKLENTGTAAEIAKKQMDGVKGAMKRLRAAFEQVAILTLGGSDGLLNKLADLSDKFSEFVNNLVAGNPALVKFVVAVVVGLGALGLLARAVGTVLKGLSGLIGVVLKLLSPMGLLLTAFALIGVALFMAYQKSKPFRDAVAGLVDSLGDLWNTIVSLFVPAVEEAGNKTESSSKKVDGLTRFFQVLGDGAAMVTRFLTGFVDVLSVIVDRLRPVITFIVDLVSGFFSLEPVQKIIGGIAAVIGGLAVAFLAIYPVLKVIEAVRGAFALFSGVLKGLKLGAFFADLGGAVAGFFGTFLTGPVGIALAVIAALAAALAILYFKVQPVRDAIDSLIDVFQGAFASVVDWVTNAVDQIGNLFDVWRSGVDVAQGTGEVIDNIFGNTGKLIGPISTVVDAFLGFFNGLRDGADALHSFEGPVGVLTVWFTNLGVAFRNIYDAALPVLSLLKDIGGEVINAIGALFSGDFDRAGDIWNNIQSLLGQLPDRIREFFQTALANLDWILEFANKIVTTLFNGLLDAVKNIPGLGLIVEALRTALQSAFTGFGGVVDIVQGIFGFDESGVESGVYKLLDSFTSFFFSALPTFIAGIFQGLGAALNAVDPLIQSGLDLGRNLLDGIVESVQTVPIIGPLVEGIRRQFEGAANSLSGIVDVLAGIFTLDPGRILSGLGQIGIGIVQTVTAFIPSVVSAFLDLVTQVLPTVLSGLSDLITGTLDGLLGGLIDAVKNIPIIGQIAAGILDALRGALNIGAGIADIIAGLFSFDGSKILEGLGTITSAFFNWLKELPGRTLGAAADIGDFLGSVISGAAEWVADNFPKLIEKLKDLPEMLFSAIGGLFGGDGGGGKGGSGGGKGGGKAAKATGKDEGNPIVNFIKTMIGSAFDWIVNDAGPTVGAAFGEFFSRLPGILMKIVGGSAKIIGTVLSGIFELGMDWLGDLGGLLLTALQKAFEWLVSNGPGLLLGLLTWIGSLPFKILGALGNLGGKLFEWMFSAFEWLASKAGEAIVGLLGWIAGLPAKLLQGLANFAEDLLMWFFTAWSWLTENGPEILSTVWNWISTIPSMLIGALGSLAETLGGWFRTAWDWIVENGPNILAGVAAWLVSLPGKIIEWLGDLGSTLLGWISGAWNWIVENGPNILAAVAAWLVSLPGQIIGWLGDLGSVLVGWITGAWNWIVENGPGILAAVGSWLAGLPGQFIGLLGDIGGKLFGWLKAGFDWIKEKGGDLISGAVDFFKSIPGRLLDALGSALGAVGGFASDIGKRIFNSVAGFLNDKLINPIRNVEFFGGKPLKDKIPTIPLLAEGGIIRVPTPAIVGEAGPEVVIPLTDPARAKELVAQSGLMNLVAGGDGLAGLAPAGGGAGFAVTAPTTNINPAPVSAAATSAMQSIATSAVDALAPIGETFANIGPEATDAMTQLGPQLQTAVEPGLQTLGASFRASFDGLYVYMQQWVVNLTALMATLGVVLWTAMQPGMVFFDQQFRSMFGLLGSYVSGWVTLIQVAFAGLPGYFGSIANAMVTALSAPFRGFASSTWNPFSTGLNRALDQIPATAGIDIPLLFPTAHEGGVIGQSLPMTGGPLKSGEVYVKMQAGEGVIPADVMSNMTARQFESIRSGGLVGGGAAPPILSVAPVVSPRLSVAPGAPSGLAPEVGFIPDTVVSGLRAVVQAVQGTVNGMIGAMSVMPRFVGGLTNRMVSSSIGFVEQKVNERNAQVIAANNAALGAAGPAGGFAPEIADLATMGSGRGARAVAAAKTQLGVPYVWGGTAWGRGLDCSGLTQGAWARAGVSIPRVSQAQQAALPAVSGAAAVPGDLVFYRRPATHVGMYVGGGQMIHAPRTGLDVRYGSIGSPTSFGRPAMANGGIITKPMAALIGEAGPEVVIPLTRPMRALELAQRSGLMQVLAEAQMAIPEPVAVPAGVTAGSVAAAATVAPAAAESDTGLFPGSGNTYNIYGVGMQQVIAEIKAREEASTRQGFVRR